MPVWRNPAAWLGLTALAIPVIVHLLARMRAQVIAFPSLRFIDVSRLAARKRRTLSDLPLLALRLLAFVLAVAACANPLFLTASRRAAWGARVSRVVVIDRSSSASTGAEMSSRADEVLRITARETENTLRSTVLHASSLTEGVARAVAWLRTAPPSRREIVLVSDFQVDSVTATLLRDVPDDIGLRLIRASRVPHERTTDTRFVSGRGPNGSVTWSRAQVHIDEHTTTITARTTATATGSPAPPPIVITPSDAGFALTPFGLRIAVPISDRVAALATIEAVLAEGVPAPAEHSGQSVELRIGANSANTDATARDLAPIAAPWMAELLQRVAEDRTLAAATSIDQAASIDAASTDQAASTARDERGAAAVAPPWRVIVSDARGVPVVLAAARARELVVVSREPVAGPVTPLLVRSVLQALAGPDALPDAEVRMIADDALRTWTRPAAEPSTDALRNVDDSDRRWFWGGVLVVLLVETWVRRDRQSRTRAPLEAVEAHEHAA
jgi:Aerotolerance regulator N-terminal